MTVHLPLIGDDITHVTKKNFKFKDKTRLNSSMACIKPTVELGADSRSICGQIICRPGSNDSSQMFPGQLLTYGHSQALQISKALQKKAG